jgi:Protein of unknown function (DUF5674)
VRCSSIVHPAEPEVVIVESRIAPAELKRLTELFFGDMVKLVVDVERRRIGVGGQLHADAEHLLLEEGSRQEDLWGANYFPGRGPDDSIEYTALINIRPAHRNRAMEVEDAALRERMGALIRELIGSGEALP